MAAILGGYGPLTITQRDDGGVSLDFTAQGAKRGPFITLNAMQWLYLLRVARTIQRPR